MDCYALCEEAYFACKDELLAIKQTVSADSDPAAELTLNSSASRNCISRAPPKISLPKFAGDYNSWPSFRDLFSSMIISNSEIPAVEKLHYLKNHVTGEAAQRISNLAITSHNFTRVWDALTARYENKCILVSAYLDALFNAPAVTRKSADDLKLLIATANEALGGLKSLAAPVEHWDYLVVYFVAKRLDPDSLEAWELQQGNTTEPAAFAELEAFLDGRTRALEMVASCSSEKSQRAEKAGAKSKAAQTHLASSNTPKCSGCNNAHYISRCPEFYAKSVGQRREFVNDKRLSYNCLGQHKLTEYRTTKRCRVCQGYHHTLLHLVNASSSSPSYPSQNNLNASPQKTAPLDNIAAPATTSLRAAVDHSAGRSQTLLATALVNIITNQTSCITARALLDQGSELTFVREKIAQCTGIPRKHARVPILGIGSRSAGSTRGAITLRLCSSAEPTVEFDIIAYVLPTLTSRTPASPINSDSWSHIRDLLLADPTYGRSGKDLILGADIYGRLLRPSIRNEKPNQPVAQNMVLGWILSDLMSDYTTDRGGAPAELAFAGTPDNELSELLCRFWANEEVLPQKLHA